MTAPEAFPWGFAMRFGLGVLRLSSKDFWAMSPKELAAAHAALFGKSSAMGRGRLDEMMTNFPDKETEHAAN